MYKMFAPAANFIKMYEVFNSHRISYVLFPYSFHGKKLSIQQIQFDFNKDGKLLDLIFTYTGNEYSFFSRAKETQLKIALLIPLYDQKLNKEQKTLKVNLSNELTLRYLSSLINIIKEIYELDSDFTQEINTQLSDREYLRKEYSRLFPVKTREIPAEFDKNNNHNSSDCKIM